MPIVYVNRPRFGRQRRRGIAAGISTQFSGPFTRPHDVFRSTESVLTEATCLNNQFPSLIGVKIH